MRSAVQVILTDEQRQQLVLRARGRRTAVRVAERARIVLLAADGLTDKDIAVREGCDRRTAALWRKRFVAHGLAGIEHDAPRAAPKRRLPPEKVVAILDRASAETPPNGKRWSTRAMARAVGVSEASVRRIWEAVRMAPGAARSAAPVDIDAGNAIR